MNEVIDKNSFTTMIHHSCLDIVKEIDRICRLNGIFYSLCGGSVIGAHLYHGFIPWDDDIDLMMTRENYDRFVEIFPKEASKRYHLMNYKSDKKADVPTLFSRVEDLNIDVTEEIAGCLRTGHVFVDITVMDNVLSKLSHRIMCIYGSYVYAKLYHHNGMVPGTPWKKILFRFLMGKSNSKSLIKIYAKYEKYCKRNEGAKTELCAELLSAAYSNYLYKRDLFDNYVNIQFEELQLMIIRDYMDYLYMRYGKREFSKEVSQEQRFNSHIVDVSMNLSIDEK